ncbi:MAG: ABC transporter substrate-binding protein [Treponema sp.]|nr:ABC transporter substrate-binding protein [Candidatus Treponema equifaecale]
MKKIFKALSLILASGLFFTACERIDLEGIGELNEIEIWYSPYTSDAAPLPEDCDLIDHIEKDLGIKLKAVALPTNRDEQLSEIRYAAATNSLPDLFYASREIIIELLRTEQAARVDSMYKLMPERSRQMYDAAARKSTDFDGLSFGLSQSGSIDRNEGILIRKDWLEKLGLPVPVTTEDYLNVMRAFTFNDPDGNGIDDTYGYGAYIELTSYEEGLGKRMAPFFGAFGVEGTYNATKRNYGLNVRKPVYYEALDYVRTICAEHLIDPDWSKYNKNQFRAAWKAGKFGIMREQNAAFGLESNYRPFDENFPEGEWMLIAPPKGPRGESSMGAFNTGFRTYAISRRSQELGKLPVIAKLLEWMSTDGYNYVAYGEEGVNFLLDDDGKVTTEGLDDPELAYTKKAAAPLLQLRNLVFHNSNEELASRYPAWQSKNGKTIDPLGLLRQMQEKPWTLAISIPGADKELKQFYEKSLLDFVTGKRRLSPEDWNEWLAEFDKMGGADWDARCKIHVDQNNLLMEDNKIN